MRQIVKRAEKTNRGKYKTGKINYLWNDFSHHFTVSERTQADGYTTRTS